MELTSELKIPSAIVTRVLANELNPVLNGTELMHRLLVQVRSIVGRARGLSAHFNRRLLNLVMRRSLRTDSNSKIHCKYY
jgi:hypothetical protein